MIKWYFKTYLIIVQLSLGKRGNFITHNKWHSLPRHTYTCTDTATNALWLKLKIQITEIFVLIKGRYNWINWWKRKVYFKAAPLIVCLLVNKCAISEYSAESSHTHWMLSHTQHADVRHTHLHTIAGRSGFIDRKGYTQQHSTFIILHSFLLIISCRWHFSLSLHSALHLVK